MASISLKAAKRDVLGKKVKRLRSEGLVPGVVYGNGFDTENIQISYGEFSRVYNQAGSSAIVTMEVGSNHYDVLIHEVDYDPVKSSFSHVDFLRIKKGEKINTKIPLEFIGESSMVKDLGGSLLTELDEVEVRCLPADLVDKIEVDVSVIAAFNEPIRIKDLKIPAKMEVLSDPEGVVANVVPPRAEVEETGAPTQLVSDAEMAKQQAEVAAVGNKEEPKKKE